MKKLGYRRPDGSVAVFTPAPQARLVGALLDHLEPVPVRREFDPPLALSLALEILGATEEDVAEGRLSLVTEGSDTEGPDEGHDGETGAGEGLVRSALWNDRTEPRAVRLDPPAPAYRALRERGRSWRQVAAGEVEIEWAESEEEQIERVAPRVVPAEAEDARMVDEGDLPDRVFREAWTLPAAGAPVVDLDRAKAIQLARIRTARDAHPDWPKIDADRAKALETDDRELLADVHARATVLRDLPEVAAAELETTKTAAEVAAVWPPPLPPREYGS